MSNTNRFVKLLSKTENGKDISVLSESKLSAKKPLAKLDIPMLNVALTGDVDGGMYSGCMQIVGDSRTFKTSYLLIMVAAFLKEHEDGVCLFFDSEQGAALEYFDTYGVDATRVVHIPIMSVEDLKIKTAQALKDIERDEKIFFAIDSIGLLPSTKEVSDAEDGKDVADMTRARALNSFWRVVTLPIANKNLFLCAINHYYDTIGGMFPEKVVKGGKGGFLAANDIWIVTRSRIKSGTEVTGWSFNIGIIKSRKVKEFSRIPIEVYYDGGVNKYSGILDAAIAIGLVDSPKKGWYTRTFIDGDKNWRRSEFTDEMLDEIIALEKFKEGIRSIYILNYKGADEELAQRMEEVLDDTYEFTTSE